MRQICRKFIFACFYFLYAHIGFAQSLPNDYLISIWDSINSECGYKNMKGDTVIPFGRYTLCFTDTFKTYALVLSDSGFIAIDRNEKYLYHALAVDNGPDYVHEGYFRIVINGKVGFANAKTGKVVIKPQFDCAEIFKNGMARVSYKCFKKYWIDSHTGKVSDEHFDHASKEWFWIDKSGKKLSSKGAGE